tara:strand:+ start:169 stop:402 length:234 start_codon:yes stop_codon:yes gene_type:complete
MYNTIVNPESGRAVNIYGKTGRKVLQKYGIQSGGMPKASIKKKSSKKRSPKNVQRKRSKKRNQSKLNLDSYLRNLFK